ncbi:MAG TPA: methyltransferase domain-containing protein [Candidatus Limnocylindrales bacterium]
MDRSDPAYRGQRDYNQVLLALYDPIVVGQVVRRAWGCPPDVLFGLYRDWIRVPHLDVGPGTGIGIDKAGLPDGSPITLLDPNTNVLDVTSKRLTRFDLTLVEADVLKPLPVTGPYQSAALSAVLHCLPGPKERKALAVANIAAVLGPDGVLFGATVLGRSAAHNRLGRVLLQVFNRQGGFDNLDDSEASTREILDAAFHDVEITVVGTVACFVATRPRSRTTA